MRPDSILVPLALLPLTSGRDVDESLQLDDDINPLGFNQHVIMASSLNGMYSVSSTQGSSFGAATLSEMLSGHFSTAIPSTQPQGELLD